MKGTRRTEEEGGKRLGTSGEVRSGVDVVEVVWVHFVNFVGIVDVMYS